MNDPPFTDSTIAIVGVGLIGGSLGLAFKRLGIGREIIGISRAETLREARALDVIDSGYEYDAMDNGVKRSDLVFLCSPIVRILEQLPSVVKAASPGCIIT
ncbi:MAG: prephenate dehydrogenase/arogenate dehydrogenase family protein, partial [Gemmatimonadetes bacterium]|nr:prephenate dehydrogenase/arogenate dehydrogenase family protein [Gemmatimonadota bacterium]